MEGWQWVTLSIYDMGGKHQVYRYGERQAVIASPRASEDESTQLFGCPSIRICIDVHAPPSCMGL